MDGGFLMDNNFELRIVESAEGNMILQYRTKDKWLSGSTTNNSKYIWSVWKDVPIFKLGEY